MGEFPITYHHHHQPSTTNCSVSGRHRQNLDDFDEQPTNEIDLRHEPLNFWALPAQDVAIQGSRWVGYSPLNNISITPLEFTILELEDFVDFNQSLYADGQVTAAEANRSGDDYTKYVYPVNNVAHTMIQQFDMGSRHRQKYKPS